VHVVGDPKALITQIVEAGMKAAIAVKPKTPLSGTSSLLSRVVSWTELSFISLTNL
jgi:pentose-5-phosphate-3-epimerase